MSKHATAIVMDEVYPLSKEAEKAISAPPTSARAKELLDDIAAVLQDPKIAAAEEAYWEWDRKRADQETPSRTTPPPASCTDTAPVLAPAAAADAARTPRSAGAVTGSRTLAPPSRPPITWGTHDYQ